MSGLIPRAIELSHLLLARAVRPGDTVIDATAGLGRDTCFLAALVGEQGQVWAFDIQEEACQATRAALAAQGLAARVQVICDDHARVNAYAIPPVAAAIFNLGWLPGSDHILTSGPSTLAAFAAVWDTLASGGALVAVCYPGHEAGQAEYAAIQEWLSALPPTQVEALQITFPRHEEAPVVLLLEKR